VGGEVGVLGAGDAAGLNGEAPERVGVHDLRHSFVAVALAAGLTLPEAAALARHANPRVTATVYAGLTDTAGRAGGEACGGLRRLNMTRATMRNPHGCDPLKWVRLVSSTLQIALSVASGTAS
jgi:hypothetical protein